MARYPAWQPGMPLRQTDLTNEDGSITRYNRRGSPHTISAGDAARTAASRDYAARLDPGARNIAGVQPQLGAPVSPTTAYAGSVYDSGFYANNPGLAPQAYDPALEMGRQQLSSLSGMIPGRSYSRDRLAIASPAQIAGELAAIPTRLKLNEDARADAELGRKLDTADIAQNELGRINRSADHYLTLSNTPGARTLAGGAGRGVLRPEVAAAYDTANEFATSPAGRFRQMGGNLTGSVLQDFLAKDRALPETHGYDTAEAARAAIPKGMRGQVQQNAKTGKWNVQAQTAEEPHEPLPGSGLAKMQSDLRRAISEGRTDEADQLRFAIHYDVNPHDRPLNSRDFFLDPELRNKHGRSYTRYREAHLAELRAALSGSAPGKPSTAPNPAQPSAPPSVKTDADYAAVPSGSFYMLDGQRYRKR